MLATALTESTDSLSGGSRPSSVTKSLFKKFDALPYLLIAPLMIFIIGLAIIPAVYTIVESFYKVQPLNPPNAFYGFNNFKNIFANPDIRSSLTNTILYVVIGTTLSTILGIFMAITLQRKFPLRSLLIAILILPWALPGVVEGILWTGIFDANSGVLNSVLTSVHAITQYQVFLGQNHLMTIFAIELVQVWQITPLSALLILAALQNIPEEIYEAATVDGSTGRKAFWFITLPLVRPGIAIALVQAIIVTLNIFDQPYILNGSASTGASLNMQTYFISFQNLDFGAGYAISLLVTLITIGISLGFVKLVYRRIEY